MHDKVAQDTNDDGTSSSAYGMPESTVATTLSSFNPTAGTSDLDTVANTDGICEVCHVGAIKTSHNGGTGAPGHGTNDYRGTNCATCHQHSAGFKGGACDSCHGDAAGNNMPNGALPDGTAYPNREGSHLRHVTVLTGKVGTTANDTCVACHPGNPPIGHSNDSVTGANQAEVIRMDTDGNGYIGPTTAGDYWAYAGGPTATSGTPIFFKTEANTDDTDAYYRTTDNKCYNSLCHSGVTTHDWNNPIVTVPPATINVHANGTINLQIPIGTASVTLTTPRAATTRSRLPGTAWMWFPQPPWPRRTVLSIRAWKT